MSCEVEQIADCGDIFTIGRALFIPEREETIWLSHCCVSLSSCGSLLAIAYKNRLCLLTTQWISATDSNTYLVSWSGTLPAEITVVLALPICPSQQSSQNGPDWFCIIVGFVNGNVGFYTDTGHLLFLEKFDDRPVTKISCHTGTYGTLPDDIHIFYRNCECTISGLNLFQTLRSAKAQLARVQAGIQDAYTIDSHNINIRKWTFTEQDVVNDAAVVGLELKNTYDHLLAASTYGGYDTWYRSIPPVNTLVLGAGVNPYIGFHYALEGGTTPPLQDVARAVANKIKSALPGWLGGGSADNSSSNTEPAIRPESLSMRCGLYDTQRHGVTVAVSPDRRLAAFADSVGRVAVLDITKGHLIRLFKGYRDAQCAFVQIFQQDDKKPQLSIIKEIKRAVFLLIYNPRKGLIDIRLMQTGNRVAVFTATKNGKLIYNTCGLVGAEKNCSNQKLNLPELQCVFMDPDGKLKKFNIPFFYALDNEHSEKSKDLHILRELRDFIKKMSINSEGFEDEILKRASCLKTLELKKHCIEILIRNYEITPKVVMACLQLFWNSIANAKLNDVEHNIKSYFANLVLVTLFYRHINNEPTDDMQELLLKINPINNSKEHLHYADEVPLSFTLLEDDNCILERMLFLAQENDYREQQHTRVTFVDIKNSTYKEFISCFSLEGAKNPHLSLKSNIGLELLNKVASDTFKSILNMNDLKKLSHIVRTSNIDPKEIVKLIIIHVMNMSLDVINIELIEKLIAILYYACRVAEEATNICYNEMSPWWEDIRSMLLDMPCPLKSMIVAMACKAVSKTFESGSADDDAWESVTKENAKWGILIGKLEDISLLSISFMFKDTFNGNPLPQLPVINLNINLKYIYTRGRGSVTELIAKWLCGMGVLPEAIMAHELLESHIDPTDSDSLQCLFVENNRIYVDNNPTIFKWLSLLRRQFPLSTSANYVITYMCWEYAMTWQKEMQKLEHLAAVVHCLKNILHCHLKLGLFHLIWTTYIKQVFENSCRLVNKVGRLPKDLLCLQDLGFNNVALVKFLEFATKYLSEFLNCSLKLSDHEKETVVFEKIWDDTTPSLIEVAQNSCNVDIDILKLHYQISCTIYYQCHFNLKFSKPLDILYDIDYQYIFDALTSIRKETNLTVSDKLKTARMKFITKLVKSAIETISYTDNNGHESQKIYNNEECVLWTQHICTLADLWNINDDFVKHQQIIGLYHVGYDVLAENVIALIKEPELLLPPLVAISIQRLKRNLEHSSNQPEWIATVPPQLYKRLQNTVLDESIPPHSSLATTVDILQKLLYQIEKINGDTPLDVQNIKIASLIIDSCKVLIRRKL